jgi:hypothetical protein
LYHQPGQWPQSGNKFVNFKKQNIVKKISYWAKKHIWQSRLIIILIYILLNVLGILTGKLLSELHVTIPQLYFIACLVFTTALWIWYPGKGNVKPGVASHYLYIRRKLFDFSLGAVTFLMIIYAANNWEHLFIKSDPVLASNIVHHPKDSAIKNNPLIKNFIAIIKSKDVDKLSQREKLKLIKDQIKTIKHDKETSKGEKTLLIILSVIIALGLLFGLAAISCSLSCSGSEALAIIVGLGGTVLIIFLLARVIKHISNPPPKKEGSQKPAG